MANPEIYMPQFGGYDPIGVVRGVALAGNPGVWIIASERLFLFYDEARRYKFAKASDRLFVLAQQRWPEVVATVSR